MTREINPDGLLQMVGTGGQEDPQTGSWMPEGVVSVWRAPRLGTRNIRIAEAIDQRGDKIRLYS